MKNVNDDMILDKYNCSDIDPFATNDVIVYLADQLKLTQKDLVEQTGLHKSQMSRIFNKKEIPTKEQLERLSVPLKISKELLWLIGGYILPESKEGPLISELKTLNKQLKSIHEEIKNRQTSYEMDSNLTTKEKEFIKEYIEFTQYRKEKDR